MITKGSQVKLHYTVTVDDQVVDTSRERGPLTYVHGEGQIVPGLEKHLEGMKPGESKKAEVPPAEAYGDYQPEAVQQVDKSAFSDTSTLKVGDVVQGQAQGESFQATVVDIGDEAVSLDLNHPLAGKTLHFDVEIVEVG